MPRPSRDLLIRLIAVFKLVKAVLLIAIGVGALSLRHHHGPLSTWIHALVFDPHGKYFHETVEKISGLDTRELTDIAVGSVVYAVVFAIEGVGLMRRRAWAEVLTVIITTSFIPLEIYELVEHRSWMKIARDRGQRADRAVPAAPAPARGPLAVPPPPPARRAQ